MYADLREKLSILLMQYPYKTIDNGLRELIREFKYHFDQDYALIAPVEETDTSKNIVVSMSSQNAVKSTVTVDTTGDAPKKVVVKKPRKAKSGSKAVAESKVE